MRASPVLLILLCFALLAGCHPAELPSRLRSFWEGGERIPFETIAQEEWGVGYPYTEPRLVLLTTVQSVNEIADYVLTEDLQEVQQIDFSTYAVIAVFRGVQPGSKHDVVIETMLIPDNGILTVAAHFLEPYPKEGEAPAETYPYHLVKIAKSDRVSAQTQLELQITTRLQ